MPTVIGGTDHGVIGVVGFGHCGRGLDVESALLGAGSTTGAGLFITVNLALVRTGARCLCGVLVAVWAQGVFYRRVIGNHGKIIQREGWGVKWLISQQRIFHCGKFPFCHSDQNIPMALLWTTPAPQHFPSQLRQCGE